MKRLASILTALLTVIFLVTSAQADCTTPSGYKRWGSGNWRVTATVPGSPAWQRLPTTVPSDISTTIQGLALMGTGIAAHITTNSRDLRICWENTTGTSQFPIWSQTGASGIDVYYRAAGSGDLFKHLGVGEAQTANDNVVLFDMGSTANREYLIYLPSNRKLGLLRIETLSAATLTAGPVPAHDPMVVLGSSIAQCSGTSRPGICWPMSLARHLDADVVNLGFSGSCQLTVGMAQVIATVDASAYVIDCFPNMTVAQITAQVPNFVNTLYGLRPTVPIYVVGARLRQYGGPSATFLQLFQDQETAAINALPSLPTVTLISGADLLGDDLESMIDDSHPSDLGHFRQEAYLEPLITLLP